MASASDDSTARRLDEPSGASTARDEVSTEVHHETRGEHARRLGSRAKLYTYLILLAVLVMVIVLLALDNRDEARLSWVVGETDAPVVWIVLVSAIVGWLAGLVTGALVRRRTRLTQ